MFDREKFHWSVQLQAADGRIVENYKFSSYWSPKYEGIAEAVAEAAAVKAWYESSPKDVEQRTTFAGLTAVQLVD